MINLRGLGDCDSDPNDPVCQTFYGTGPTLPAFKTFQVEKTGMLTTRPSNQPGTVVTTQTAPGTAVTTVMPTAWFKTWKGVVALGAGAAAAYYLFKKPKASQPSPATAAVNGLMGIFGRRRRRSRRR